MGDEVVRRELSHALDMWARETRLTFTELAPDDTSADIQVEHMLCYLSFLAISILLNFIFTTWSS